MGNLSENFSSYEFACKCCGMSNPNPRLVEALQEYRDLIGNPVIISSGGRCPSPNEPNPSHHRVAYNHYSNAADCIMPGMHLIDAYMAALEIEAFHHGGIGIYPRADNPINGFLHLDVRRSFARWARVKGVYIKHQKGLDYIAHNAPYSEIKRIKQTRPGKTPVFYNVPIPE
jgi:hypothetical protein